MSTIIPIHCKHCSSTRIAALDLVEAFVPVAGLTREADGTVEPEYASGNEVLWETQHPRYFDAPYYCRGCDRTLTLNDITPPDLRVAEAEPAPPVRPANCGRCDPLSLHPCGAACARLIGDRSPHALPATATGDAPDTGAAAVAALQFALTAEDGIAFLRLWNEGEFDACRREWPEAPVAVYQGADPLLARRLSPAEAA